MKRIEKIGNKIVVTDTVTANLDFEYPSKDLNGFYDGVKVTLEKILNGAKRYLPFSMTNASGSVELTGGSAGSVDGITVNSIQVMSGAEAFDTDLPTTAQNVANNINAFTSSPNYTATANGAIITITATVPGGLSNGYAVVSSATTITTSDTNMSGATTSIVKASDVAFDDEAELVTWLRTNTGA